MSIIAGSTGPPLVHDLRKMLESPASSNTHMTFTIISEANGKHQPAKEYLHASVFQ